MPVRTVSLRGVELVKAGKWGASTGPVEITKADLAEMVANAARPDVDAAPIKLGHIDPRFDGEPAQGWVRNLRLSSDGGTLIGDLEDVPSELADQVPTAYPRRSVEIEWGKKTPDGTRLGAVLHALALLGVSAPAVKGLADVYRVAASEGDTATWGVALLTDTNGVPLRDTPRGDGAGAGTTPASDLEDQMGQTNRKVAAAAAGTDGKPDAKGAGAADSTKTDATSTDGTATGDESSDDEGDEDGEDDESGASDGQEATQKVAASAKADDGVKTVTLSQGQYDELVAGSKAGVAALAQIDKDRRDGIITAALSAGQLAPADQKTWRAQLDKDEEGTVALLSTLAPGTVPVTPLGHAELSAGESASIGAAFDAAFGLTKEN